MPESATRSSTVQTASQQVRAFIAKSPNSKVVKLPIPQMFVNPAPALRPQNQKVRRKRALASAAPAPKSNAAPDPSALAHSQTPGTACASQDPQRRISTRTDRCPPDPPYAAPAPHRYPDCPPAPPASDTPDRPPDSPSRPTSAAAGPPCAHRTSPPGQWSESAPHPTDPSQTDPHAVAASRHYHTRTGSSPSPWQSPRSPCSGPRRIRGCSQIPPSSPCGVPAGPCSDSPG